MATITRLIMWPFSQLLNLMFDLTGSYGFSIILFAVIIRLLMLYPTAKSKRNMLHMNRMNPKLAEIKKRCGNNQEKYALEVQKLYKEEGVNPMGGCLWSLLPLPILIALYGIIQKPITAFMLINMPRKKALETLEIIRTELADLGYVVEAGARNAAYEQINIAKGIAEHFEEIRAVVPQVFEINFNFLGVLDLSSTPWTAVQQMTSGHFSVGILTLVLLPIISGALSLALMVITQRSNPNMDPQMKSQQTMMAIMMPLMSLYIGFILPASLGIYWVTMNLFAIVQEVILQKYYGAKLDKEEAEREEAARQDRIRRMEAAKNRPQAPAKSTSKDKKKRMEQSGQQQNAEKKKNSTTEAGRIGDRPYARGRSFGNHYED